MTAATTHAIEWNGLTVCYWLCNQRPPLALPVELAAAWLDSGEYPVFLGSHADAMAVVAPVAEPFAETLFASEAA